MAKHNENKLSLIYDKRQKDFVVKYPRRCDGALILHNIINEQLLWDLEKALKRERFCFRSESLKDELERRGYDLTTLKFSIELKK
jgi:hypothetical protein